MGLFRKEEENFDDSAAFENSGGGIKMFVGVVLLIIIIAIGFVGYNQYQNWTGNETTNETINVTQDPEKNIADDSGNIVINFTDFNLTVKENPGGIYYYHAQDKVVDEKCYINGKRKSCKSLTNNICSKEECEKKLVTEKECFVNGEKIDCPEE